MNADKCHLLITNHENDVSITIDGLTIECCKSVKLLGVCIDNNLNFNEHVSNICKMVSKKLHALRRVSQLMNKDKLRILMKSFIESQFGYCPLLWMFDNRSLNNRINILHEKALRLVYSNNITLWQKGLKICKKYTMAKTCFKVTIGMYRLHFNQNQIPPTCRCHVVTTSCWGHETQSVDLTNSIFEVIKILKQVIPLNQAQFADEQNVVVCLYCATGVLDLGIFSVKSVNFRHFECDVIVFQLSIFD